VLLNIEQNKGSVDLDYLFSCFNYVPLAVLILDDFNHLLFYNQEAKNLLTLEDCTEESLKKFESVLGCSVCYMEISADSQRPRFGNNFKYKEKSYIYDLLPVIIGEKVKYKIVVFRDPSYPHRPEKDIRYLTRENYILRKIIDSSYDGIYITDHTGKTLYFNDAFMRISGFKREETIGKRVQDLVASNYLPKSCAAEVIKQRKTVSMTIDYYSGVEGMLSGSPVFDEDGKLIRTILNVRDMTDLNRLNKELKNATALTASYRQQLREVQLEYQRNCNVVSRSKTMRNIIDLAIKTSSVDSPVLILGESGVGKDVVAKFIHNIGERAKKGDLIKINCGAIPETLLESELFGYEPGAFTGAKDKGKVGLFELADGGTFFLDEIGDLPLNLQVKLLDVLQEGSIYRIGGTKPIPVNARIIAATNKNLEQMIKQGKFRLDLFYRLNVISMTIPPLRERKEDIVALVEQFLDSLNQKYNSKKFLSPQALDRILQYDWPGNIRELRNIIERLVVTSEDSQITVADLPEPLRGSGREGKGRNSWLGEGDLDDLSLKEFMEKMEALYLKKALDSYGNLKDTARALRVDISTVVRKKRRYNI
jgi:PAS domain S-box-containing protein